MRKFLNFIKMLVTGLQFWSSYQIRIILQFYLWFMQTKRGSSFSTTNCRNFRATRIIRRIYVSTTAHMREEELI